MLVLRPLIESDEPQAMQAHRELLDDGFLFLLGREDVESFAEYVTLLERQQRGEALPDGHVPGTLLVAEADGHVVGRVHIRHHLTDRLRHEGGHCGYGVRPAFRRRGYATEILRQALGHVAALGIDEALVTCSDDNVGSRRTIERCGGQLADVGSDPDGRRIRRYWVPTAS